MADSEQHQADTDSVAREVVAALDSRRQVPPFTQRLPGFGLRDAYVVTAAVREMREKRGERPIGRKIGFTNRTIWDEYGVHAPIWGYMYESTLQDFDGTAGTLDLSALVEPRIEPEIAFGMARAPEPGMNEADLLTCIGWVAHGFEVVQSLFPGWRFAAADTIAGLGLHGAYRLGPRHPVAAEDRPAWLAALSAFEIRLARNGEAMDTGQAANVLDGPLSALKHLVGVLADDPLNPPLSAGEIVTTGTLTRAFPVAPGEEWSTTLSGIPLPGLSVRFTG